MDNSKDSNGNGYGKRSNSNGDGKRSNSNGYGKRNNGNGIDFSKITVCLIEANGMN